MWIYGVIACIWLIVFYYFPSDKCERWEPKGPFNACAKWKPGYGTNRPDPLPYDIPEIERSK